VRGCKAYHWEAEELKRKDLNLHFADGTWKKRCKTFVSKKIRSCRKITKEFSIDFQNGLQLQQQSRSAIMGIRLRLLPGLQRAAGTIDSRFSSSKLGTF
jgi:hypothetical protein